MFGDGLRITGKMPTPRELADNGSWLERIAGTVGLEKWMWKSRRGLLIAIVIVPPGLYGLVDFWKPVVTTSIDLASPYIEVLGKTGVDLEQRLIAFLPEPAGERLAPLNDRAIIVPAAGNTIVVPEGRSYVEATVYRLVFGDYDPLDGHGISKLQGRWHTGGIPLLYSSNSVLAAVKELKRMAPSLLMSPDAMGRFVLHEVRVAGLAETLPTSIRPLVMSEDRNATQQIGDEWLRRGDTGLLVTPSPVDPAAHTILVNLGLRDRIDLRVVRSMSLGDVVA